MRVAGRPGRTPRSLRRPSARTAVRCAGAAKVARPDRAAVADRPLTLLLCPGRAGSGLGGQTVLVWLIAPCRCDDLGVLPPARAGGQTSERDRRATAGLQGAGRLTRPVRPARPAGKPRAWEGAATPEDVDVWVGLEVGKTDHFADVLGRARAAAYCPGCGQRRGRARGAARDRRWTQHPWPGGRPARFDRAAGHRRGRLPRGAGGRARPGW